MPIPQQRRAEYPCDWAFLSWNIVVRRAGGRCECDGRCGRTAAHLDDGRCRNRHGQPRWRGKSWQRPVILSTVHLGRDPSSRDLDDLQGWCESCHLAYDSHQHWATRRRNFEERAGLLPLPGLELV